MTQYLKMSDVDGDFYSREFAKGAQEGTLIVNVGPQHPATHGVLRVLCELDGEYVLRSECVLGYLHRMHEKMGEVQTYYQFIPNMGRVDYLHPIAWNWAWVGAVERLAGIEVEERAEYIRVITCELNRINSHLLWWGAFLLDLGGVTPILYAFDDREWLVDILQRPTGSRLTYSYFRIGGVQADVDDIFVEECKRFIPHLRGRLSMYKALVTENIILRKRLEDVGNLSLDMARHYGATGPVVRGSGLAYDTRRAEPYGIYDRFDYEIPTSDRTDCMGRYLVRMDEIEQSLRIIEQALEQLPSAKGSYWIKNAPKPQAKMPAGDAYFAVEGARGKIGINVVSDGSKVPYRVRLRAPGFANLTLFSELSNGVLLPDMLAILGSLDMVIPEIDR